MKIWINKNTKTILELMQKNEFLFSSIIGFFYQYGIGCERNFKESIKWYRLSSKNGNASAQYFLGDAYQHGLDPINKQYKGDDEDDNVIHTQKTFNRLDAFGALQVARQTLQGGPRVVSGPPAPSALYPIEREIRNDLLRRGLNSKYAIF